MELKVLDELRVLLDPLTEAAKKELEVSISSEGVRDKIVVWKGQNVIVDGHNRYEVATRLKKPFSVEEREFPDIEAVKTWMIRNQIGRRNLTPDRFTYFLGKLYQEERKTAPSASAATVKVAKEHGVSERTVRRAESVASGVDLLAKLQGQIAARKQLDGEGDLSKAQVEAVGKASNTTAAAKMIENFKAVNEDKKEGQAIAKTASAPPPPKAVVSKPSAASAAKPAPKASTKAATPAPAVQKPSVAFINPNYDSLSFSVDATPCPDLDKNAVLYIVAPDGFADKAIYLSKKWGFQYDGMFIFTGVEPEEGVWSKITHIAMVVASRGTVTGPAAGKEAGSVVQSGKDWLTSMHNIINAYHPSAAKHGMK